MSFIFGGNTDLSYDQLQQRRKMAQAMMQAGMSVQPVTAMQGLNAAAKSIAGALIDKKFGKQEQTRRDAYNKKFQSVFGGMPSQAALSTSNQPAGTPAPGSPAPVSPVTTTAIDKPDPMDPAQIGNDAMKALGQPPHDGSPVPVPMGRDAVIKGLVARGLPQHVAQGIAMNMQDESSFNPAAVGDNGNALGLAQWNGPRMAALKQFAQAQGKPATDPNVQMDFMMHEFQGPEAGAFKALQASTTPQEAATAFLNKYERPAEVNRVRREAKYTGAPQGTLSTSGQPQGLDLGSLAALASSPYATPEQKAMLNVVLQQHLQQSDPYRQLQMQKTQAEIDKLHNPNAAGKFGLNLVYGKDANGNIVALQPSTDGAVHQVQLPPGVTLQPGVQKVDLGTAWGVMDRGGNIVSTVPKDLAGAESAKAVGKTEGQTIGTARASLPQQGTNVQLVNQQITDLLNDPYLDHMLGPIDSRLPNVSGDANRVQAKMDQIQGQAFMAARQMLKGGGQITDYEGKKAESAFVRMNQAQSPEDFRKALEDFRSAVNEGYAKLQGQAGVAPQQGAAAGAQGQKPDYIFDPATGKLEPAQ